MEQHPLEIPEVLSEVLSYLTVPDLKQARQVNKAWRDWSTTHFRRLAVMKLSVQENWLLSRRGRPVLFPEALLENTEVKIDTTSNRFTDEEFTTAVGSLFHESGSNVKNLALTSFFGPGLLCKDKMRRLRLFEDILIAARNLETLTLDLHFKFNKADRKNALLWLDGIPELVRVTKLELTCLLALCRGADDPQVHSAWMTHLLGVLPNVQTIKLANNYWTTDNKKGCAVQVLCDVLHDSGRNLMLNLTCVQLERQDKIALRILLLLKTPLKKIDFGRLLCALYDDDKLVYDGSEIMAVVYNVLEKNKDSLEELKMHFSFHKKLVAVDKMPEFPQLPKLTTLAVQFDTCSCDVNDLKLLPKELDMLQLSELFKKQSVLDMKMPQLNTLSLTTTSIHELDMMALCDYIFAEKQLFPRMRRVNFSHDRVIFTWIPMRWGVEMERFHASSEKLLKIFPNADIADLSRGRIRFVK